jgi:hypothetical protein
MPGPSPRLGPVRCTGMTCSAGCCTSTSELHERIYAPYGHEACQGCPARLVAVRRLSGGTRRCSGRCRRIPTPSRRPGSRPWSRRYPTQVRPVRDDRAVVRSRLAPATDPLGRQQALPAQQAEDPFPAHLDLMLATEPGADLAVALASERRGDQHLVDQPEQVAVADRGCRTRPDRPGRMSATSVERGAGRAKHPAHHRHRQLGLHGYLGRFAGGIWSPLVSDAARRISFSMVSCPILRSACLSARSSGRPVRPLALQAFLATFRGSRPARPPTGAPPPRARATAPPTARHVATGAPRRSSCPPTKSEGGRDVHRRLLGSILRCRPAEDGQICLSSDHGRLVQACQSQSPAPP